MSLQEKFGKLEAHLKRLVVGQERLLNRMLVALLSDGHLLVEGAPGLAKTRAIKVLSHSIEGDFHRLQFTPDLLPADLTGTEIYRPQDGSFVFREGPLFHNLVLADEVNRAPAKVQSALLEAMGERQITVGSVTYPLPALFMVMATQNPIEQEGTYPLPEAQIDRFMLHVQVGYPTRDEERKIMERMALHTLRDGEEDNPAAVLKAKRVVTPSEIMQARKIISQVYVDEKIKDYVVDVVLATRDPKRAGLKDLTEMIAHGASPRASIALNVAARAHAFMRHRGFVTPEDVKAVGADVLRHRLIRSYEAEAEEISSDQIVRRIFEAVEVP